jgi:hypothetical protein
LVAEDSVAETRQRAGKTVAGISLQRGKSRALLAVAQLVERIAASTVLSIGEEVIVVTFRRHALLPLDDCLYALQGKRSVKDACR